MCDLPVDFASGLYDQKYIIMARTCADGSEETRLISRALPFHADIVESVEAQFSEDDGWQTAGGGILVVDSVAKHVRTFGMSGGFGKPKCQVVERCLAATFKDGWTIDATVTSYVRGG
jgi:hypothetical protein